MILWSDTRSSKRGSERETMQCMSGEDIACSQNQKKAKKPPKSNMNKDNQNVIKDNRRIKKH